MHRIEIDDEVYAALEKHAKGFQQPNDVLRLMLLGNGRATGRVPATPGALAPLIELGLIKPGDALSHRQVRKGREFSGAVEADGWIRTELGRYETPSPALGKLVGTSIDGWAFWVHVATGKTLLQLRRAAGLSGRSGS